MALAVVLCAGCKKEVKTEPEPVKEEKVVEQTYSLETYHYTDSVKVGAYTYAYTLHREADEALGIVVDEYDDKWVNTFYLLKVWRNGAPFFEKRFEKETLGSLLPEDFRKSGIIDGFRFTGVEDAKLCFSLCVSYPNSDMSAPFLLTIGPDGSYSMKPDEVSDVMNEGEMEEMED